MTDPAASLARYAAAFEQLTPERLDALAALFAPTARFKDPFNDVRGRAAVRAVFAHMFEQLDEPRFEVTAQALDGAVALLHWRFRFRLRGAARARCIEGMSRVQFDAQGLVSEHVDHWDPAEQVYAGLPLLGALLRWLRRRLSAGPG